MQLMNATGKQRANTGFSGGVRCVLPWCQKRAAGELYQLGGFPAKPQARDTMARITFKKPKVVTPLKPCYF